MPTTAPSEAPSSRASATSPPPFAGPSPVERPPDLQLVRWGGAAGLGGVFLFLCTVVVVGAWGLPDADDVETLTDFADIETGRIAEHLLYLGALMLFTLHVLVLHRLVRRAHPAAALFGTVFAAFGLAMMAVSSLLHVSTAPLANLYTAPDTTEQDQRAIEYAWHGAQSVFDTMLTTGALLVPIGIVLLGVAMLHAPMFGRRLAVAAIGLGIVGAIGAVIEIIDTSTDFVAASVAAIAAFELFVGWRTLVLGRSETVDLTDERPG